MDNSSRLEANAIIDRLVENGSVFSRADARRLIELLPVTRGSRFSFKGLFQGRGPDIKGHAAGVGDVEMKGETVEKKVSLNVPVSHRIGGYVVTHTPGEIEIELMWAETREDWSGQSCALRYNPGTKEPEGMFIAVQKTLQILFMRFGYVSYAPWKKPAAFETTM